MSRLQQSNTSTRVLQFTRFPRHCQVYITCTVRQVYFSGEEKKRQRGIFHAVPLAASDSSENSAAARYRIEIENSARVHGGRDVRLCQWLLIVVVVTVFVCLFVQCAASVVSSEQFLTTAKVNSFRSGWLALLFLPLIVVVACDV